MRKALKVVGVLVLMVLSFAAGAFTAVLAVNAERAPPTYPTPEQQLRLETGMSPEEAKEIVGVPDLVETAIEQIDDDFSATRLIWHFKRDRKEFSLRFAEYEKNSSGAKWRLERWGPNKH